MEFELHLHTSYSDGSHSPLEMIEYAKEAGLDGIAITDHNEIEGALIALDQAPKDFHVIPGIEVSSLEGHILGLGLKEKIPRDLPAKETIDLIHELGGIAIAAHAFEKIRSGLGEKVASLDLDAVEIYNGRSLFSPKKLKKLAKDINLPVVGGSDAHFPQEIGSVTIYTKNNPIKSIPKGEVDVNFNTNRRTFISNYLKSTLGNLI